VTLRRAAGRTGSILVFPSPSPRPKSPHTATRLKERPRHDATDFVALINGSLDAATQDRAILPPSPGRRKVSGDLDRRDPLAHDRTACAIRVDSWLALVPRYCRNVRPDPASDYGARVARRRPISASAALGLTEPAICYPAVGQGATSSLEPIRTVLKSYPPISPRWCPTPCRFVSSRSPIAPLPRTRRPGPRVSAAKRFCAASSSLSMLIVASRRT